MDRYQEIYSAFRWEVPARYNIAEACCGRWARDRTRFALRWEDENGAGAAYTFWDLQEAANRCSNALAALGVAKGDRVAVILAQRPETAIAYLAILQLGAIAVPLSHLFGPDALAHRLGDAGAAVVIVEASVLPNLWQVRDRLDRLRHIVGVGGARETGVRPWEDLLAQASRRFVCADTAADDPALIMYTSGTTGLAKGALLPHRALIGNLPGFVHSHNFFPQSGDMMWSPADWAWTGGLWNVLLATWAFGFPLLGYRGRFDAERAFHLLEKYQVRNAFLFPTALKFMMKAFPDARAKFSLNLRSVTSGGESVGAALIEWARENLGVTINEIFGQTEANYVIGNCNAAWPVKVGSIGRPFPGHRVAIVDEHGREVPRGEAGEIAVGRAGNPVLFLEYWNNPAATARKVIGDWVRTGDEGRMDEDGYIWYHNRTDDVIKSAGYRIGPGEIESCLVCHPAVANAAVIGKPDAERGMIIVAFIVLQPGFAGSEALTEEIQRHVRGRLAPYEYPREIRYLAEFPMTTTGKVKRQELRQSL